MDIKIIKIKNGKNYNKYEQEIISCLLCKKNISIIIEARLCYDCKELNHRIRKTPEIAIRILETIFKENNS